MRSYSMPCRLACARLGAALAVIVTLTACKPVDWLLRDSLTPETGTLSLAGLQHEVSVRRDALGVPVVIARTDADLMRALGYVHASDRLSQMISFALLAQGRLAEMAGPVALDMDIYMRTLGLRATAEAQWAMLDPELRQHLADYAAGVNAWIDAYREHLPLDLRLSGQVPHWQPLDSIYVYLMLNLGLSLNLNEEIAFLNLAQTVGAQKAAWLIPSYPDDPIHFAEAAKLGEAGLGLDPARLAATHEKLGALLMRHGIAASNNWVVHKSRTAGNASLLANDTHLLLTQPALWSLLQTRSPSFNAAGVSLAGLPGVVIGFNGTVAWGMTMVMADNQDLFVERLRQHEGRTEYLWRGQWLPVTERNELITVKGASAHNLRVATTRHGPLIDQALRTEPRQKIIPASAAVPAGHGLALQWTGLMPDHSLKALFGVMRASSFADARAQVRDITAMHFNLVLADKDNISWQVTGRYPVRGKGLGLFPSPGWTGEYDWDGWVPTAKLPAQLNPPAGFIGSANARKTGRDFPHTLTHSWYMPERGERIDQVLAANRRATSVDMRTLQADRQDLLAGKLKALLTAQAAALDQAIGALPDAKARDNANWTRQILLAFDGEMAADSADAATFGIFLHVLARETFLDELGPETGTAWRSFMGANGVSYSAQQDHLLGRDDSPFWDDVRTPQRETKTEILARALAGTAVFGDGALGKDRSRWQWGRLHTYHWQSGTSELRPWLTGVERFAAGLLGRYLDRGPYPAGGSPNTLNVAGYAFGEGFDVWDIPAMRMVVDFSAREPLQLTIAGGQSANPASPHYDDGIPYWLAADNRPMAFHPSALEQQYDRLLTLTPANPRQ